jgi:L-Ala-D/L-Glu epimerase
VIHIETAIESWELDEPFVTARDAVSRLPVITATLRDGAGHCGWAEAAGVDYDGDTPQSMAAAIASLGATIEDGFDAGQLHRLLPAGGARNALDCALWDLRAKQAGEPVWKLAGLAPPSPVMTAFTIGLCNEEDLRRKAAAAVRYPVIKLKLDAERHLDVVRIVREAHPRARLLVDANQAFSRSLLERLLPALAAQGVELIEQPLPRGQDAALDGFTSGIPLAADESCTDLASLEPLCGRYQYVNIKLDKCGGLTEALAMCAAAKRLGLGLMVGNMCGSSLAMAPAFLVAQQCRYVDLDGPLLQRHDRVPAMRYGDALLYPPEPALWG